MNQVESYGLATIALTYLAEHGFSVLQTSKEELISRAVSEVGKTYLTPMLDPRKNDFTAGNSFWLILYHSGNPVLVGGARFDDLGGEVVSAFWKRSMRRVYGGEERYYVGNFQKLCDKKISGRVAYFGDMFGSASVRKKPNIQRSFLLLAHLAAISKWSPDVIYAFIRGPDMDRGADRVYGFLNAIPSPQQWLISAPHRDDAEWCVFNGREEMDLALHSLGQKIT